MSTLTLFHNCYRCTGAGGDQAPHLVLLHGWGLHSIVWDDIMPALLVHFQVTVIDLPGMGQSPLPAADYSLHNVAAQVAPLLPAQCHLLGWSLGGLLALKLASERSEQIVSLTLVASTPRFVSDAYWPGVPPALLDRFIEIFDEDAEGTLIRFLALNCKDGANARDDVRKLREMVYFCGLPAPRALRGGLQILRDTDLRAELAKLRQPHLLLFGGRDNIVPAALAQTLAPAHRVALMAEVAHVPFLSQPQAFVALLFQHWRELCILPEGA